MYMYGDKLVLKGDISKQTNLSFCKYIDINRRYITNNRRNM